MHTFGKRVIHSCDRGTNRVLTSEVPVNWGYPLFHARCWYKINRKTFWVSTLPPRTYNVGTTVGNAQKNGGEILKWDKGGTYPYVLTSY